MQRNAIFLFLILFGISAAASADTVILKSGKEIKGKVLRYDEDPFYLRIKGGKISFSHKEVTEVKFDNARFNPNEYSIPTEQTPGTETVTDNAVETVPFTRDQLFRYQQLLEALEEANNEDEESGFNEERAQIVASLSKMGRQAAPYLEKELGSGNQANTPYVLRGLVGASPARGLKAAEKLSSSGTSGDVRVTAITLLGEADPDRYQPQIAQGLQDTQASVRAEALHSLGGVKDVDKAVIMVDLVSDTIPMVRAAAMEALRQATGESFETAAEWSAWFEARDDTTTE